MDNNKPSYGVGAQSNIAIKPYQLDYEKLAAESKSVPAKKTVTDIAGGALYNAGKTVNNFVGGVWNKLRTPAPAQPVLAQPVKVPVVPAPMPPTPEEWEALKDLSPGDRAQMLELLRATNGQQK
jgi:hypothetical protein